MNTMEERRQAAVERLKIKRDFRSHVAIFAVVNTLLIVIWAATGAGYFWPIWPIAGWGIALAYNAYMVYFQKPITEDDIQAEIGSDEPSDTPGF